MSESPQYWETGRKVLTEKLQVNNRVSQTFEATTTLETYGILRNNGESSAQVSEADLRDVHTIDDDRARRQLYQPVQGGHNGTLARSSSVPVLATLSSKALRCSPSDDADLLSRTNRHGQAPEHGGQLGAVLHDHVVDLDLALRRPWRWGLLVWQLVRRLLFELLGIVGLRASIMLGECNR